MVRTATRLAAGTLALALPLAAVAGCGAAKKRTIKQEFAAAQANLEKSEAATVTLRFDDSKGNTLKAITQEGDAPEAIVKELLGGSISWTAGAAGGKKIGDITIADGASEAEIKKAVEGVSFALSVKDAKTTVAEIRLVDSTLFARVDFAEVDRLAEAGGEEGFSDSYDEFVAEAPADVQPALKDAKAGKWLKLPLSEYLDDLQGLTEDLPTPAPGAGEALGKDLFAAVKPHITVTDANDDSSKRVLAVKVDARPALKAVLQVLKTNKSLPFGDLLGDVSSTDVDDTIAAGTVNGTLTLSDGHLTQATLDIESIRKLDPDAGSTDLTGSSVVLDIDDSADGVKAPTDNVSSVDVKATVEGLFQGFFGGVTQEDFTSTAIPVPTEG